MRSIVAPELSAPQSCQQPAESSAASMDSSERASSATLIQRVSVMDCGQPESRAKIRPSSVGEQSVIALQLPPGPPPSPLWSCVRAHST